MSQYRISAHSIHAINYHFVFCPKRRKPVLTGELATDFQKIIEDVCGELGVKIENLSIMPDHVHLFVTSNPKLSPYIIVKKIKGRSSNFLRKKYPILSKMQSLWSSSYYCGSVGFISESVVRNYIENQKGK